MSTQSDAERQLTATTNTRDYYEQNLVDRFYTSVWGGHYINIGVYDSADEDIITASQRTVEKLATLVEPISPKTRVLDLGSGYGGSARYLAKTYGCHVTCLNLSPAQNTRNRELCNEEGLEQLVTIIEGSFEEVPLSDHTFDLIWSQDAFLHSGNRPKIIDEIDRLLVHKGGQVVFTDIMQGVEISEPSALEAYLQRLPVADLATVGIYQSLMKDRHFFADAFQDLTTHLATHYTKVRDGLENYEQASMTQGEHKEATEAFFKRSKTGLTSAVSLATKGTLQWGIFVFQR